MSEDHPPYTTGTPPLGPWVVKVARRDVRTASTRFRTAHLLYETGDATQAVCGEWLGEGNVWFTGRDGPLRPVEAEMCMVCRAIKRQQSRREARAGDWSGAIPPYSIRPLNLPITRSAEPGRPAPNAVDGFADWPEDTEDEAG